MCRPGPISFKVISGCAAGKWLKKQGVVSIKEMRVNILTPDIRERGSLCESRRIGKPLAEVVWRLGEKKPAARLGAAFFIWSKKIEFVREK